MLRDCDLSEYYHVYFVPPILLPFEKWCFLKGDNLTPLQKGSRVQESKQESTHVIAIVKWWKSYQIYKVDSLSRLYLSRITAYLEVKIWSLFKHENLTTGNNIL